MNYKPDTIKVLIVVLLLSVSIGVSFILPKKVKYEGTDFISELEMPDVMNAWHGEDVSSKMNINFDAEVYGFVNDILAYQYADKNGKSLLFILLDAGNFHFPNTCLTKAGYQVTDLDKTELRILGRTVKAYTLKSIKVKDKKEYLVLYWIVIDGEPVPNWLQQKIKQFFFSLFNKKRVGLMVRIDVPIQEGNIKEGIKLARKFVNDLGSALPTEYADFIFGKVQ